MKRKAFFRALLIVSMAGGAAFFLFIAITNLQTEGISTPVFGRDAVSTVGWYLVPAAVWLLVFHFPYVPFAPQLAAVSSFAASFYTASSWEMWIEKTALPHAGEVSYALTLFLSLVAFVNAVTAYCWIQARLVRKLPAPDEGGRYLKAFLRPGQDMIFWGGAVILYMGGSLLFLLTGSVLLTVLVSALCLTAAAAFLLRSRKHTEQTGLFRDLNRYRQFVKGAAADPGLLRRAGADFHEAERLAGGRLLLGQNYIYGKKAGTVVAYEELRELKATSEKDSLFHSGNEYRITVRIADGREFTLCRLPARNVFQPFEEYRKRNIDPVFSAVREKKLALKIREHSTYVIRNE